MPRRYTGSSVALNAFVIVLSLVVILPIMWSIAVAFNYESVRSTDFGELLSRPFTLDNFAYVLTNQQARIALWIGNSLLVAASVTTAVLLLASSAAFAFARFRFVGRKLWFWVVIGGIMVPAEAKLIPLYLLFRDLRLLNTYWSLILPAVAAPFGVVILYQFIRGLPEELFDAAKIDGASSGVVFRIIVLPLTRAALASLAIFVFLGSWNDFLWPFIVITKPSIMTVPVGIPFFNSQYASDMARPMAANVIASAPVLIAFFLFQRNIVEGISLTGIKG